MTTTTPGDGRGPRHLPLWGFAIIVIVYLAIIQGGGLFIRRFVNDADHATASIHDILVGMWIPLGAALLFTYAVIAVLRWWRPVFRDDKPVQRWVAVVPIALLVSILLATNYVGLAEKGFGFIIVLLIACQFVGWGEEGMFRGIGVVTLRGMPLREGYVALWSSVIFGAVHLTNVITEGVGALAQAAIVSVAGYFFYLTRRRSGSNWMNSVLHGLFDFALLSGTAIAVGQSSYPGTAAVILVYVVLAVVLVVRRRHISPSAPVTG